MQCIPLAKAAPGMILAQAVTRSNGPVLIGKGIALTDAVIKRIAASGIAVVWVEGAPGEEGDTERMREVAESLPYVFRRQKDNVFMMTLRRVFEQHFATRLAGQKAREDAADENDA